ncbi:PIG-L family deacetylase [soil metagenome]
MNNNIQNVILAVGAHPDDMDFGASGTIAKFIAEGYEAYYLLCTDGSRGADDTTMTHEKLAQTRREEQIAAGKILGLKDIFFLDHPDTQLLADLTLKEEIVRVIRTVRPRIVITMDPTFFYTKELNWGDSNFVNHTDHRAAGLATMDAVFPLCRDRLTFPEHEQQGLTPHVVEELWFTNMTTEKNHIVNITDTLERKLKALECHKSQFDDFETIKKRMTERAIAYAEGKDFEYGENFIRLLMPGHRK